MSEPAPGYDPTVKASSSPNDPKAPKSDPASPKSSSSTKPTQPALPDEVVTAGASAQFGNFVRTKKLGAGGMGEVWKAWDTKLNRWVALKFLKGGDEDEIARFEREAQTAGRLTHPHIAAIYEVGQDQGRHYIVMQFVEGRTLKGHSREDLRASVDLVRDAAEAVQYAHEQGIVHRDLKPENLMVSKAHVYVMDFGLARATEGASGLSVSGQVVGTPSYMPPEQAKGQRVDARADVYSLGATLYEVLTGKVPFRGENVYETLRMVQEEDPRPPGAIDARIDGELETIVLKCMEKSRERRYGTAGEVAADLTRWLKGEPIHAVPPSITYRLKKFAARRKAILIPAVLAALLVAGLVVANGMRQSKVARDRVAAAERLETDGKIGEARDAYRSALDADGSNREASAGLERTDGVLKAREREREARDAAEREAAKLFEAGRGPIDLAIRFLYRKDAPFEEVTRRVKQGQVQIELGIAKAPHLPLGHLLLGLAWELQGWLDRAEASLRRAVELDPKFGPARFRLGRLLLLKSYIAGTHSSREEMRAKSESVMRLMTEASEQLMAATASGSGLDEPIRRQIATAMLAAVKGEMAEARKIATEGSSAFRGQDGDEEFAFVLGMAAKSPEEGLAAFSRAIEIRPRFVEALMCRGVCLRTLRGDERGALADFEEAMKLHPRNADVRVNRGNCRFALGEVAGAREDYDEAIRLDGTMATAWRNRGMAKEAAGDRAGALKDLDESIRLEPREAYGYYVRGFTLNRMGEKGRAMEDFLEAVRIDPHQADAHFAIGNAKYHAGKFAEAVTSYDAALAARPGMANVLMNRGVAKAELGDREGAVADLREALRVAPAGWRNRGDCADALERMKRRE